MLVDDRFECPVCSSKAECDPLVDLNPDGEQKLIYYCPICGWSSESPFDITSDEE